MDYIRTIIPLAEFKAKLSELSHSIELTQEPLLVTRHGKGAFVVQSIDSFVETQRSLIEAKHRSALAQLVEEFADDEFKRGLGDTLSY